MSGDFRGEEGGVADTNNCGGGRERLKRNARNINGNLGLFYPVQAFETATYYICITSMKKETISPCEVRRPF